MAQYLPIFALLVLAIVFGLISRVASRLLGPRNPTVAKSAPYECGIIPDREPPQRFPVKFFLVAMIFIVFDIEVIFLFPWAVVYRSLGPFGLFAIVIFAAAVFESFVYLISNGALDWGPIKQLRRVDVVDPTRTTTTTIRRVGLEGRDPVERPRTGEAA
jgi:NADH-quinone oxidoreductase subunit A